MDFLREIAGSLLILEFNKARDSNFHSYVFMEGYFLKLVGSKYASSNKTMEGMEVYCMDMLTVYHGTTKNRSDVVVNCGFISVTTAENQRYRDTSLGKIYVTTEIYDAMEFSIRPELDQITNCISVFRIEIDCKELVMDIDELEWTSTLSTRGAEKCYTIDHNLIIGTDVVGLYEHSFESNDKAFKFLQKLMHGEERIDKTKWIVLSQDK